MKKSVLAILSLILAFALLSCGAPAPETAPETAPGTAETAASAEKPEPVDFGGHEFVFLIKDTDFDHLQIDEIYAEALNGEAVNDAVWRRNAELCETYHCRISQKRILNTVPDTVQFERSLLAGEHVCDLIYFPYRRIQLLASRNLLADLNGLKNLDLDDPCWDQDLRAELTLRGRLFGINGDAGISDEKTTNVIYFNRKMAEDSGLESPFSVARRGEWTVEKLYEYSEACKKDVDGDGVYTKEKDVVSFMFPWQFGKDLVSACGGAIVGRDENGEPFFPDRLDENAGTIWAELEPVLNRSFVLLSDSGNLFRKGGAAFYMINLASIRNYDSFSPAFGLLPLPKRNAEQKEYLSPLSYTSFLCFYGIPVSVDGMEVPAGFESGRETCAAFLDRFGKASAPVQKAYLETFVKGQKLKNGESAEMLDLALAHRVYDFAALTNFASIGSVFTNPYGNATPPVAEELYLSVGATYENRVESARRELQNYLDAIEGKAEQSPAIEELSFSYQSVFTDPIPDSEAGPQLSTSGYLYRDHERVKDLLDFYKEFRVYRIDQVQGGAPSFETAVKKYDEVYFASKYLIVAQGWGLPGKLPVVKRVIVREQTRWGEPGHKEIFVLTGGLNDAYQTLEDQNPETPWGSCTQYYHIFIEIDKNESLDDLWVTVMSEHQYRFYYDEQ